MTSIARDSFDRLRSSMEKDWRGAPQTDRAPDQRAVEIQEVVDGDKANSTYR